MQYGYIKYFAFFLFLSSIVCAQPDKHSFTPSVYYTYGNYSNNNYSNSYSAYGKLVIDRLNYLVAGFDDLLIHSRDWNYDQQTVLIGGFKNYYPFYLKANYLYIQGEFNYKPFGRLYDYTENTHLINGEVLYNVGFVFFGASYSFLSLKGLESIYSNQIGLSFIWRAKSNLSIAVKPYYTAVSDERSLFSAMVKVNYSPWENLMLILNAAGGERAYFFNTDLLTIFNQPETQKTHGSVRVEYSPFQNFAIIGAYQHSEFSDYTIDYFVGGFKYNIGL